MNRESELWRPALGFGPVYAASYEVSNRGRVRSRDRLAEWGGAVHQLRGRMLTQHTEPKGYRSVHLSAGGSGVQARVHVLVLSSFVGPRPDGFAARHLDGDPANNCPSNLSWGTYSENEHDKVRHGRNRFKQRTHCPRGHLLAAPNLVASRPEHRRCLACARGKARCWKLAARGFQADLQGVTDAYYAEIMKAPVAA